MDNGSPPDISLSNIQRDNEHFSSMLIEAIAFLSVGLLIYFLSLPLAYRKVPMNQLYGIRIPASFESKERWYDINAYGGRQMAGWAWLIVAASILGFILPDNAAPIYAAVGTVAVLLAVLIPLVRILRYARSLPPETAASQSSPVPSGEIAQPGETAPASGLLNKRTVIPAMVWGLLSVAYVFYIGQSAQSLPPRIATHFDASGHANGWMTREFYVYFIAILGLALAAFIAGLGLVIGIFSQPRQKSGGSGRTPGRNQNQSRFIGGMFWLASILLGFIAGTHHLVIEANRTQPPHLQASGLIILVVLLIGASVFICLLSLKRPRML
jgi:uncharacterized membrane protein